MERPVTTLFMLMSVDGKISTGAVDDGMHCFAGFLCTAAVSCGELNVAALPL